MVTFASHQGTKLMRSTLMEFRDATHGVIEVLEALRQVRHDLGDLESPRKTAEMPGKNREKPRESGI